MKCERCAVAFDSRNKLFKHLKLAKCGHSAGSAGAEDISGLRLYVIGGRHRNKTLGSSEYFSFETGLWKAGPDLCEHRGSHGATTIQGKTIYTLSGGGMHSNLSSCERLDTNFEEKEGSWTLVAPMAAPMPKHALAVCSYGERIYAVGGWANGKCNSSDFEVYDVAFNKWIVLPSFTVPRRLLGAVATQTSVYVFGGAIDNSNHLGFTEGEESNGWVTGAVERFDVETQAWQRLNDLPLSGPTSAVSVHEEIFVIVHGQALLKYDILEDSYIRVAILPLKYWYCFDCCSYGSKIYITGGSVEGRWSTAFFSFDLKTLAWTRHADMQRERRRAACAIVKSSR